MLWLLVLARYAGCAVKVSAQYLAASLAGALLLAQPAAAQQSMQINANQSLGSVGVYRTDTGRRVPFICPAGDGKTTGTIYGTDVYTDSSPICPAAIHAGVLRPGEAGVVTIVVGEGAESFTASERNGVTSRGYGRYRWSYTFARDDEPGTITWRTTWNWNERPTADFAEPIAVTCPPEGVADALIYGTDVYSVGSAICVAAVHAGVITADSGGIVTVTREPASQSDPGSERYGIISRRLSAAADAFRVRSANTLTASTVLLAPALLDIPAGGIQPASGGSDAIMDPASNPAEQLQRGDTLATGGGVVPPAASAGGTTTPARNPASVTATLENPNGDVLVSWTAVPGAARYGVASTTDGLWRDVHAPATSVAYTGLPAGQYTFSVGAYFEPGAVSSPANEWPNAALTVPPVAPGTECPTGQSVRMTQTPTGVVRTVVVPGAANGLASGVAIQPGFVYRMTASGSIRVGVIGETGTPPEGWQPQGPAGEGFPAPDSSTFSLLYKVGSGGWNWLGPGPTVARLGMRDAPGSQIFFSINDNNPADNSGSFTTRIEELALSYRCETYTPPTTSGSGGGPVMTGLPGQPSGPVTSRPGSSGAPAGSGGQATGGSGAGGATSGSAPPPCACTSTGPFRVPTFHRSDDDDLTSFVHPDDGSTWTVTATTAANQVYLSVTGPGNRVGIDESGVAGWGISPDSRHFVVVWSPTGPNAGSAIAVYEIKNAPFRNIASTEIWPDGNWGFSADGSLFIVKREQQAPARFDFEAYNLDASNPRTAVMKKSESGTPNNHRITVSPCGDRLMHFRWTQLQPLEGRADFYATGDFPAERIVSADADEGRTTPPTAAIEAGAGANTFNVRLTGARSNGQATFPSLQCEAP